MENQVNWTFDFGSMENWVNLPLIWVNEKFDKYDGWQNQI